MDSDFGMTGPIIYTTSALLHAVDKLGYPQLNAGCTYMTSLKLTLNLCG